jgi:hypothetical protein
MIRRVTRPTSASTPDLTFAALPPGTPVTSPMHLVYVFPAQAQVGSVPADALVTSDGAPVYATGAGRWAQLAQAGPRM